MSDSSDPRSDAELVRDADFDPLYFRHRDWVLKLAWRFTLNQEDALDVLQETFLYVAKKLPSMTLTATMRTFLYPVVRNLSLEIKRKKRPTLAAAQAFNSLPAPTQALSDLSGALTVLSELHREVVLMRFVDDLSLEEISQSLVIPLGTVKSRLHNALEQLRADPKTRIHFEI